MAHSLDDKLRSVRGSDVHSIDPYTPQVSDTR